MLTTTTNQPANQEMQQQDNQKFMANKAALAASILPALSACLLISTNPGVSPVHQQSQAETFLRHTASASPLYPVALLAISLDSGIPLPERQLAAISLKQYIDTHWSNVDASSSTKFIGPEPSVDIKCHVKSTLLSSLTLGCPPGVQGNLSLVISKITHIEWPEQWPDLFDRLLACLKVQPTSSDEAQAVPEVEGALGVLGEFIREDLSDAHIPLIAPLLLPELTRILTSPGYLEETKTCAISIIRDFCDVIALMAEDQPNAVTLVEPYLPIWCQAFAAIFHQYPGPLSVLTMKTECVTTSVKIFKAFPRHMNSFLPELSRILWKHFMGLTGLHGTMQSEISLSLLDAALYGHFEFFHLALRKKSKLFSGKDKAASIFEFLSELMMQLVLLARLTPEIAETWEGDLSQFIQDEDPDTSSYNMRLAVIELITGLVDVYPRLAVKALCNSVLTHLSKASADPTHEWCIFEAGFLLLGRFYPEIISAKDPAVDNAMSFDIILVIEEYILPILSSPGSVNYWVQSRALWLASVYVSLLPPAMVAQFMKASITMCAKETSIVDDLSPFYLMSLRASTCFVSSGMDESLIPLIRDVLSRASAVDVEDEVRIVLVESVTLFLDKLSPQTVANMEPLICSMIESTWIKCSHDVILTELLLETLQYLAKQPPCIRPVQQKLLPKLLHALHNAGNTDAAASQAFSLDCIGVLLKYAPAPIPVEYVQHVFPSILELLIRDSEDPDIAQNGQQVLALLLDRDPAGIMAWRQGDKGGLEYIIQWVAFLLREGQSESKALFVGDLITKLIQVAQEQIGPVLPELLGAVAGRLASATNPAFIQTLVIVFAQLIHTQQATVLDFLSQLSLPGPSGSSVTVDGLSVLCHAWCDNYDFFQGYYALKISTYSLCMLLNNPDPRLDGLRVKGDLVVEDEPTRAGRRITTRSMALQRPQKWTSIPFRVKAVKLIVRELAQSEDGSNGKLDGVVLMDEASLDVDDEFDDEDEDDGEGDWDDVEGTADEARTQHWHALKELANQTESEDEHSIHAADPVMQVDMKAFFKQTLSVMLAQPGSSFGAECEDLLSPSEKAWLRVLM